MIHHINILSLIKCEISNKFIGLWDRVSTRVKSHTPHANPLLSTMAGTSLRHFIKHLPCTILSQLPIPCPLLTRLPIFSSLSGLSSFNHLSLCTGKLTRQWSRHCSLYASVSASMPVATAQDAPTAGSGVAPYCSVLIRCRKDEADMLGEALLSFGAGSVSMDEHGDYENSDEVSICSVFTGCQDVEACICQAADSIGLKRIPTFELLKYNPYDWIKRTQESFDPVEVTKGFWIVPEWKTPPDFQATNIILNPGLAFGTGEHATTKLCLLLLHDSIKGGEHVLDYGTGSGILSIAALKLGATLSVGVDIDPQAVTAASQNAILNNIGPDRLKLNLVPDRYLSTTGVKMKVDPQEEKFVTEGAFTNKNSFDIVVANILLRPLLELADDIVSHAKEGGLVGLSGILSEQLPQVTKCYSEFLDDISVSELDDWAVVSGTKKRSSPVNV
ncbi:hypothetical protein Drorol1_Dr00015100 [Drosera rotundifolia]